MKEVQPPKKPLLFYYLIALILLLLLNALLFPRLFSTRVSEVDYGTFLTMIENKTIGEVEIDDNEIIFSDNEDPAHYYKTGKLEDGDKLADLPLQRRDHLIQHSHCPADLPDPELFTQLDFPGSVLRCHRTAFKPFSCQKDGRRYRQCHELRKKQCQGLCPVHHRH